MTPLLGFPAAGLKLRSTRGCRCRSCLGRPPEWAGDIIWDEDVTRYLWIFTPEDDHRWRLVVVDETDESGPDGEALTGHLAWDLQALRPCGWTTVESGRGREWEWEDERDEARSETMAWLIGHFLEGL